MRRLPALIFLLAALPAPVLAAALELEGHFIQGGLVIGRTEPGAEVRLEGRALRVGEDGSFVFGFGRDAPATVRLQVRPPRAAPVERVIEVARRRYEIQRIDGLPPAQVTPPPEVLERIRREAEMIAAVRRADTPDPHFRSGWLWPVAGPVTGIYGSQRILNGEPRQPHFGIDIAAPEGAPVVASTDGTVTLAERDLYFTGGTVVIDHGHGLSATYSHLLAVRVQPGQSVRQGEVIGTVGATGRVTGPHLDWRVNWFETRLDPALLLPPVAAENGARPGLEPRPGAAAGGR